MATATLTSKGQLTIPNAVRDSLHLHAGDRVAFVIHGESPEKPYSGKFMVRVEPELHKAVVVHAKKEHKSLNAWVHDALELATK